ncbi:MAG: hypothetical protein R3B68_07005 [Phycisphaerales bacterium]
MRTSARWAQRASVAAFFSRRSTATSGVGSSWNVGQAPFSSIRHTRWSTHATMSDGSMALSVSVRETRRHARSTGVRTCFS